MFNKSRIDETVTNTIIGAGMIVEGAKITGAGCIRIDGSIIGEIEIDGNVILGESGRITGDIIVNHALIAGEMRGNIICREKVHLPPTAKMTGNIKSATLIIDEGAIFNGLSEMSRRDIDAQASDIGIGSPILTLEANCS